MRESTLVAYTNPRDVFNCCHFAAWALAKRCTKWGLHNLKLKFLPPIVDSVSLLPVDQTFKPQELFEAQMFMPGGVFHETNLNHYLKIRPARSATYVMINAGYLLHHFIISDQLGYRELKRLLDNAEEASSSTIVTTTTPVAHLQTEGDADQERNTGCTSRDDNEGE